MDLTRKQQQFNAAMELFNTRPVYRRFGIVVSVVNVSLQAYLLWRLQAVPISSVWLVLAFGAAYLLTDFINGLVHMYMDNNDNYLSIAGPLVANFHLHHKVPQYRKNPLLIVYFMESGSKVWLVGYLLLVAAALQSLSHHPFVTYVLIITGILSSVAEVSHYLCHSSTAQPTRILAGCGILLSKRLHARHHLQDNCNYAFLNGFTDPLLNYIASCFCKGYKQQSDLHFADYAGIEGDSR